jgi:hypothetical protein
MNIKLIVSYKVIILLARKVEIRVINENCREEILARKHFIT